MKTINGTEIEVGVDDIKPFINDKYLGFKILWSGNIGWGEYTIYKETGTDEWYADDEYMESPKDDRTFLKLLLDDFMKQVKPE